MTDARVDTASHHTLLRRVRAALDAEGRGARADAPEVEPARLVTPEDNLVDRFRRHASAAGMIVHEVTDETLTTRVTTLLRELGAQRIIVGGHSNVTELASAAGVDVIPSGAFDPLFDADAALTDVAAAIAETGSLVVQSSRNVSRGAHVVAPIHIAIVRRVQLLPDLLDFFASLDANPPAASATVIVTGPSKTADIEGVLVTGVHGPEAVHVMFVG